MNQIRKSVMLTAAIFVIALGIGSNIQNHAFGSSENIATVQSLEKATNSNIQDLASNGLVKAYVQSVNPIDNRHGNSANLYNVAINVIAGSKDPGNQQLTVKADGSSETFFVTGLKAYESKIVNVGLVIKDLNSLQLKWG